MNHVVATLPTLLKSALTAATAKSSISHSSISDVLKETITAYDDSITKDLFDLFPGGINEILNLSDQEIDKVVNDQEQGGSNRAKVARCMHGSTVLVSLIDPSKENIWVVSLGDCQAGASFRFGIVISVRSKRFTALGTYKGTDSWNPLILSTDHNAQEASEVARVRKEHPGEQACILNDRVLGAIAITRGSFVVVSFINSPTDLGHLQLWETTRSNSLHHGHRVCSQTPNPLLNSQRLQ